MTQVNAWIDLAAQICHEANRELQKYTNDPSVSPHWAFAPEWQKDSAREGVINAVKGQTPEQLHESWCEFKQKDGWSYGVFKDELEKTHPCLVPYAELPKEQKLKDHIFSSIVQTFKDAKLLTIDNIENRCWACFELDHVVYPTCVVCERGM
jgi:hypothetical protein